MITQYIQKAMEHARYEILSYDGSFFGEITECQGVYANAATLEKWRNELEKVLEEWILFRTYKNLSIPVIEGWKLKSEKKSWPDAKIRADHAQVPDKMPETLRICRSIFGLRKNKENRPLLTFQVYDLHSGTLKTCRELMKKYHDLPMDFADASLVALASEENITTIFTLDHKDFNIYRTKLNKHFKLLPHKL